MIFVYVLIALLGAAAMAFVGVLFASVSGFAREIELKLKARRLEKRIVDRLIHTACVIGFQGLSLWERRADIPPRPVRINDQLARGFERGGNRADVPSLRWGIRVVMLPLRGAGRCPAPLRIESSAGRATGDHYLDPPILLPAGLGPF